MKYFLMLAAAASLAACHNRPEDEVGAAPDQGDTTAVVADTSTTVPTDSTMGQRPGDTDTTMVQQDTTSMNQPEPTPGDSALTDHEVPDTTTGAGAAPSDTTGTGGWTDTTSTTGQDTSGMAAPADSASQPNQ
jgi:hypothetical protein